MAIAVDLDPVVQNQNLRCTADVRSLRDAARIAAFVAPSKSSTAVLHHVKIESDVGDLVISAVSVDVDVRMRVRANVVGDATVLVPARRFAETLSRAKGNVQIEMLGSSFIVNTDTGRHTLPTWPVADFPELPETRTPPIAMVTGADLARMVRRVGYAQSANATREHLYGTLIERAEGVLRMIATDGHRMVVARTPSNGPDFSVLVHRAVIDLLARVDLKDEPEVMLCLGPSRVYFSTPDIEISGRIVDAVFPRWQQVIPAEFGGSITVDRKAVLGALRAIATGPRGGVRLDVDREREVVRLSTDDGHGHEASIELEVNIAGEPPRQIGFAQQYVRELLNSVDDDHVTMDLVSALDPLKIETADGSVVVVMPMRI